jgi:hypothetical protein
MFAELLSIKTVQRRKEKVCINYHNPTPPSSFIYTKNSYLLSWCNTVHFRTCEAAIAGLESVDDVTDKYNIEFVKVNNKKYARGLGIRYTVM